MTVLSNLKARFPKLFPVAAALVALGSVGGVAAYEQFSDDCCYPGAACCHPGAACCTARHQAQP